MIFAFFFLKNLWLAFNIVQQGFYALLAHVKDSTLLILSVAEYVYFLAIYVIFLW